MQDVRKFRVKGHQNDKKFKVLPSLLKNSEEINQEAKSKKKKKKKKKKKEEVDETGEESLELINVSQDDTDLNEDTPIKEVKTKKRKNDLSVDAEFSSSKKHKPNVTDDIEDVHNESNSMKEKKKENKILAKTNAEEILAKKSKNT